MLHPSEPRTEVAVELVRVAQSPQESRVVLVVQRDTPLPELPKNRQNPPHRL